MLRWIKLETQFAVIDPRAAPRGIRLAMVPLHDGQQAFRLRYSVFGVDIAPMPIFFGMTRSTEDHWGEQQRCV